MALSQDGVQITGLLNLINQELKKANNQLASRSGSGAANNRNKSLETLVNSIEQIENSTSKLTKELAKQQREIKRGTELFGRSLSALVKDAIIPANRKIRVVIKDFNEEYLDLVRNQSVNNRALARSTRDYIKTNKSAVSNVRNATAAYRDINNTLKDITKNQRKVTQADVDKFGNFFKIIDKLTTDSGGRISADTYGLSAADTQLIRTIRQNRKISNKQLEKMIPILQKVGENFDVISNTTSDYIKSYNKGMRGLNDAYRDSMKQFFNGLKATIIAAAPVVGNDLLAQARNAVRESNYVQSARMGVSQTELANFIGDNRFNLRALGEGVSARPVDSNQINTLQNYGYKMGLTGKESLDFIAAALNNSIRNGLLPTTENLKDQMDSFYRTMQQTGVGFEELKGIISDVSGSPAFLQLAQAKGYKNPFEQIEVFTKMLTMEGYSANYLKQILELNKQQQYQGVEEAVKSMVGINLLGNQINRSLGYQAISRDSMGLAQESTRGMAALIQRFNAGKYDDYQFEGKSIKDMFTGPTAALDFAKFAEQQAIKFNKAQNRAYARNAASDNRIGGLVNNTLLSNFNGLAGPRFQEYEPAMAADARLMGSLGTTTPSLAQQQQLIGAKDDLVKTLEEVNNAFVPFGEALNEYVPMLKEGLRGAGQNPVGRAAGGVSNMFGGLMGGIGALGGMMMLNRFFPGGAGAGLLGGLRGMGGRLLGGLRGMGGGLLRGGRALIGGAGRFLTNPYTATIAGGLAGGYALGTGIDNLPKAWGGDKLSDSLWAKPLIDPFVNMIMRPDKANVELSPYSYKKLGINPNDMAVDTSKVIESGLDKNAILLAEIVATQKELLRLEMEAQQLETNRKAQETQEARIMEARKQAASISVNQ